jgi:excisionase family DNA binding protein
MDELSKANLTHADLAERLRLPLSTTVDLRKREGWPHVRLGRKVRFTEAQIAEIIASHTVTERPEPAPVFEGQRPSRGRRS